MSSSTEFDALVDAVEAASVSSGDLVIPNDCIGHSASGIISRSFATLLAAWCVLSYGKSTFRIAPQLECVIDFMEEQRRDLTSFVERVFAEGIPSVDNKWDTHSLLDGHTVVDEIIARRVERVASAFMAERTEPEDHDGDLSA